MTSLVVVVTELPPRCALEVPVISDKALLKPTEIRPPASEKASDVARWSPSALTVRFLAETVPSECASTLPPDFAVAMLRPMPTVPTPSPWEMASLLLSATAPDRPIRAPPEPAMASALAPVPPLALWRARNRTLPLLVVLVVAPAPRVAETDGARVAKANEPATEPRPPE